MKHILLLEDDAALGQGIRFALENDGIHVELCTALSQAQSILPGKDFDLLILDVNLPDGSGLDLLREVRRTSAVPIILLTANDLETDIVYGLESGADDYITKPFSVSVLKIRLQNILRRKGERNEAVQTTITSGDVTLDLRTFRAFSQGEELDLSMTEFRLLQFFLENKNRALLKEQILQRVWDVDGNYVEENTLSVNVSRLRRKLGKDRIRTIQGIGYLWEEV